MSSRPTGARGSPPPPARYSRPVLDWLTVLATETALVLYEGALFILIGFAIAGLLHEFLPTEVISRHLGRDDPKSVALASLLGAPIPLCSCGVLPAVAALQRKGAGKAPLLSFAISTPETGVDSIALSWALLGPVMAIVRPLTAVATAMTAGLAAIFVRDDAPTTPLEPTLAAHAHPAAGAGDACEDACAAAEGAPAPPPDRSWRARSRRVLGFGFGTLLDEIAFWLVVGVLLTGLLSALLPDRFFSDVLGWEKGLLPMLAMAAIGVPLYLCASASTPVAAALVAKGLSPGAALVFLLTGPATNAATIAVIGSLLGRRHLRIYLGSILAVSLAAGLLLDATFADAVRGAALGGPERDGPWLATAKLLAAAAFVGLLALSFRRTRFREAIADLRGQIARLGLALAGFDPRRLLRPRSLALLALLLAVAFGPSTLLVVEPGQRGVVQRFGRVVASDLAPGLHLHLPPPLGSGTAVDVELVRQLTIGYRATPEGERVSIPEQAYYLTADENLIDLRGVVHYRVSDARTFATGVETTDDLVQSLARGELAKVAARTPIDTLYTTARAEVEQRWREALRARIAALPVGCALVDARLVDVHAPGNVHDAFRDVASAFEDRARDVHDASGWAAQRVAEAKGEAAAVVEASRGAATRARELAAGETRGFAELARVHDARPSVTALRLRLETLERALAAPRKVIGGAHDRRGDVDLWVGSDGTPRLELPPLATPPPPTPRPGPGRDTR